MGAQTVCLPGQGQKGVAGPYVASWFLSTFPWEMRLGFVLCFHKSVASPERALWVGCRCILCRERLLFLLWVQSSRPSILSSIYVVNLSTGGEPLSWARRSFSNGAELRSFVCERIVFGCTMFGCVVQCVALSSP
jgi:hypothetical protein